MRPLGWAQTQSDGCPYKKRIFGQKKEIPMTLVQKDHVKRQQDSGHLQAKRESGTDPSLWPSEEINPAAP